MSTGFYLVCDETRLFCAIACSTWGTAGDYGSTERGKFAYVISHQSFSLRVVDEHDEVLDSYLDWESLEEAALVVIDLTPEGAGKLCQKKT